MKRLLLMPVALLMTGVSCARLDTKSEVDVRPIEVKPIHITVDVNVRVDRELDQFFAFEDEAKSAAPATRPATTATQPGTKP
jgi:hypothetical protein